MNTFFLKLKLIFNSVSSAVLESSLAFVIFGIFLFVFCIFSFSIIYWFIFHWQNISTISFEKKSYTGVVSPVPAFSFSDSFKTTLKINAINELRLQMIGTQISQSFWMGFSEDKSIYRQFGQDPETADPIKTMSRLGITPIQLVEDKFQKFNELKIKLVFSGNEQRNTNVDRLLIPIMMEYFKEPSASALSSRVFEAKMTLPELKLYSKLQLALEILSQKVFRDQETTFGNLKMSIQMAFDKLIENESFAELERLKSIFYGEVLSSLALYNVQIKFELDSLSLKPRFIDFIYMSTMVATNNIPSEITPVTDNVRFLIWIQMMISYFILALLVAAFSKILKL